MDSRNHGGCRANLEGFVPLELFEKNLKENEEGSNVKLSVLAG